MNIETRFLGIKGFFRSYKNWPTLKRHGKLQLLDKCGYPAEYVDFFDGVYDAVYRNPIEEAVNVINDLIEQGFEFDKISVDDKMEGEKIQKQTGYTIGYLKGVYEVMFLERPELFNKRPSTEKNFLEK